MAEEFDKNKLSGFFNVGDFTDQEHVNKVMGKLESQIGLNDFHVIAHLNDKQSVRFNSFILIGVDSDGQAVFTARGEQNIRDTIKLFMEAIRHEIATLAVLLHVSKSEVVTLIKEDRLMEEVEKHFKGKG